jgi:hypothetical protein
MGPFVDARCEPWATPFSQHHTKLTARRLIWPYAPYCVVDLTPFHVEVTVTPAFVPISTPLHTPFLKSSHIEKEKGSSAKVPFLPGSQFGERCRVGTPTDRSANFNT